MFKGAATTLLGVGTGTRLDLEAGAVDPAAEDILEGRVVDRSTRLGTFQLGSFVARFPRIG
jgi:hypothetical protein